MTRMTTEQLEQLRGAMTPDWCIYSEIEVGLPPSLFAGKAGQSGFGPIEPLTGHDLTAASLTPDLIAAVLELRAALQSIAEQAERPDYRELEAGFRHTPMTQDERESRLRETCRFIAEDARAALTETTK